MDQLDPVFIAAAVLCGIMAVVSSFRRKSRGVSALLMAGAFLVLGAALLMVRAKAPLPVLGATGAVLIALLVAEFATRAGQAYDRETRP
jgi:hypothetical protein